MDGLGECQNKGTGTREIEVAEDIARLGLAHVGEGLRIPSLLLSFPTGFKFECDVFSFKAEVKVAGAVIAEIESPEVGSFKNGIRLRLTRIAGKQTPTTLLLSLFNSESEPEGLMEDQYATAELLGKVEELTLESKIELTFGRNVRLVEA